MCIRDRGGSEEETAVEILDTIVVVPLGWIEDSDLLDVAVATLRVVVAVEEGSVVPEHETAVELLDTIVDAVLGSIEEPELLTVEDD